MLTGEPPFTGPTSQAILARRLAEPARPLRSVRSTIPESVERAVLKALERVPADRFSDVPKFLTALESTEPPSAGVVVGGNRRLRAVVAIAATAAVIGLVAWTVFDNRLKAAPAPDQETVRLYQRGVRSYEQRSTSGAINAIQSFSRAISRDSNFSPAWAGLAKTYVRVVERRFPIPGVKPDSVLRLAEVALDRAIELDSTNAEVWVGRAAVSRLVDPTDVRASVRAARAAIALDSANGQAWHFLALGLAEQGDMQSALAAWHECVARNPTYTLGLFFLGQGYFWHHQYDSAAAWADSSIRLDENYLSGRFLLGQAEVERGNFDRALAAFDASLKVSTDVEAINALAGQALVDGRRGRRQQAQAILLKVDSAARILSPTALHTAVFVAESFAAVGDVDHALEWLERYRTRADLHYQLHLRCDVTLDPIRKHRRFRALVIEMPNATCQ